jgi:acyl-CoA reductase-like NAD-dependent aldehyde dehydrogenase
MMSKKYNITTKLFIDGEFVDSKSGKQFDVINPFDETIIASVSEGDKEDIDLAVESAKEALEGEWKSIGPTGRQDLLLKLADLWDEKAEELGELESFNNGTPIAQQSGGVAGLAQEIRYHAGWATKCLDGRSVGVSGPFDVKVVKEPIGNFF